ncbi:MAG: glycosyltransferase family 39 protein [Deltaproteobacteria bacterium]|nr:glycosyltransferase family 39 protein [Deltaproteobacteria bacterium]
MRADSERFFLIAAWLWIIGFTLFRIIYSGLFNLVPDETNYWQWSRHLAWGYHDQAPLIAWVIRLSTLLVGNTEIGVRLPSILSMTVASAYLIAIAKRWLGAYAAWSAAFMSHAILIFNVGGLLATPDSLQAAAWAACSYHAARGYEEDTWMQWLLAGCWFGAGMLGKYTMVMFPACVFLYGLLSKNHRTRLTHTRPYAALFLGGLMFYPVILWNARNGWNSLKHVAYLGGANEAISIHLKYFGDFIASQIGLLSPLVFLLAILAWILALQKPCREQKWIYLYITLTSFPVVAVFAVLSLHTRVYGNWPAAGYLTVSALIAAFFSRKTKPLIDNAMVRTGRRLWPWAVGSAYLFSALVLIQVVWPVVPIPVRYDRTAQEISGWKELGQRVGSILEAMPRPRKTFLFGIRYQIASELAFYTPGQPHTVSINKWKRPNVYDYWWKDEDLTGWDAVGVTYRPDSHKTRLYQVFDHVEPPVRLDIYQKRGFGKKETFIKSLYIYRAYGFKGGLRWVPPHPEDIRAG